MIQIKICGITCSEDAGSAVALGANALGFVFHKASPRYVEPERAREIIEQLPPFVASVGVFTGADETIMETARACRLSAIQLHGDQPAEWIARLEWPTVIQVVRIKEGLD